MKLTTKAVEGFESIAAGIGSAYLSSREGDEYITIEGEFSLDNLKSIVAAWEMPGAAGDLVISLAPIRHGRPPEPRRQAQRGV